MDETICQQVLILGDMCSFAVSADGKPGSLQKFGIDAQYFLLPISKNKLLIGMNELEEVSFNLQAINNASASLAWDYLYSPNGSTEHSMLGRLVNSTEPLIDNEELQVMVSKAWET